MSDLTPVTLTLHVPEGTRIVSVGQHFDGTWKVSLQSETHYGIFASIPAGFGLGASLEEACANAVRSLQLDDDRQRKRAEEQRAARGNPTAAQRAAAARHLPDRSGAPLLDLSGIDL